MEIKIFEEINTVLLRENAMALENKRVANYFKSDLDKNKGEIASLKSDISKKKKQLVRNLYHRS
jgi:hypothetical protein